MALFQKKPDQGSSLPLYTLAASKTVLIIGLGNPGKEYRGTRHNVGFAALDEFATTNDYPRWLVKKDLSCKLSARTVGANRVILCKPTTYMNASGEAAQAVQHFYKITNADTLVVYDELALGFGQLRTRIGGSDAGHNGVKSVIACIGEDFGRLRIGIGNEISGKSDLSKFVLSKFSKTEQATLPQIWRETSAIITEFIFSNELPRDTRSVL